jgi:hypothetical protein
MRCEEDVDIEGGPYKVKNVNSGTRNQKNGGKSQPIGKRGQGCFDKKKSSIRITPIHRLGWYCGHASLCAKLW